MHAKNRSVFLVSSTCERQKWDDRTQERKKKEKPTPNTPKVYLIFSWIVFSYFLWLCFSCNPGVISLKEY